MDERAALVQFMESVQAGESVDDALDDAGFASMTELFEVLDDEPELADELHEIVWG